MHLERGREVQGLRDRQPTVDFEVGIRFAFAEDTNVSFLQLTCSHTLNADHTLEGSPTKYDYKDILQKFTCSETEGNNSLNSPGENCSGINPEPLNTSLPHMMQQEGIKLQTQGPLCSTRAGMLQM